MKILFFILLLVLAQVATPQQKIKLDTTIVKGKLENGLTYLLKENHIPENNIEFRLVVNAGTFHDAPHKTGTAHFIEHMAFNGTKNFEKNTLISHLQNLGIEFGADINASTHATKTLYKLPVPNNNDESIIQGLVVLKEWLTNITFDKKEIEKERAVVEKEYISRTSKKRTSLTKQNAVLLNNDEYLKLDSKYFLENLNNISKSDLLNFYKKYYTPSNACLIIVGDFNLKNMEKLIREYFAQISKTNKQYKMVLKTNHQDSLVIEHVFEKNKKKASIDLLNFSLEKSEPDTSLKLQTKTIKERLFSSMLKKRYENIQTENNESIYKATSGYYKSNLFENKYYKTTIESKPEFLTKATYALIKENERLRQHGFTTNELGFAKNSVLQTFQYQNSNQHKRNNKILSNYIQYCYENEQPFVDWDWKLNFVDSVLNTFSLYDFNSLLKEHLSYKNSTLLFTTATIDSLNIPENKLIKTLIENTKEIELKKPKEKAPINLITKELIPGTIIKSTYDSVIDIETITLSNNVKVILKQTDFEKDKTFLIGVSPGGTSTYTDEEYHQTKLMEGYVKKVSVNNIPYKNLEFEITKNKAGITPSISYYWESLIGTSYSTKGLEFMFQHTHQLFDSLTISKTEFNEFLSKQREVRETGKEIITRYIWDAMWKTDPRKPKKPTDEVWDDISFNTFNKKVTEKFSNPREFTFMVIGDYNTDTVKLYCKKYIASLPSSSDSLENTINRKIPYENGPIEKRIPLPKTSKKTTVRTSFQNYISYTDEDEYYLKLLTEYLSIKFKERIREDKSLLYSIKTSGYFSLFPKKFFDITFNYTCKPKDYEKINRLISREINQLKNNGIEDSYIHKLKEAEKANYKQKLKTNSFWYYHLWSSELYSKDPKSYLQEPELLEKLNSDIIQNLAKKLLKNEYKYSVIFEPEW